MRLILEAGADKCVINSQAVLTPELISEGAEAFGTQCIVVSIGRFLQHEDGCYEVFTLGGKKATGLDPVAWAQEADKRGAGEIILNSINRDGLGTGYDLGLIEAVSGAVSIPVIACGGAGKSLPLCRGHRAGECLSGGGGQYFQLL